MSGGIFGVANRVRAVPTSLGSLREHLRQLADSLNAVISGRLNNKGEGSLAPNVTSTVVYDRNLTQHSIILFMGTSNSVIAELAAGTMYVASISLVGSYSFTIAHGSSGLSGADRSFRYIIFN